VVRKARQYPDEIALSFAYPITLVGASSVREFMSTLGDLRGYVVIDVLATAFGMRHLIIATFTVSLMTRHETIA